MSHDNHQPYLSEPPPYGDLDQLREYLSRELKRIEIAFNGVDLDVQSRWEHMPLNLEFTKTTGGGNTPSYSTLINDGVTSVGVVTPWFSSGANQSLFFNEPVPHSWKEGSTIRPYINFTTDSTPTAGTTVVLGLEYTIPNLSGTVATTSQLIKTSTLGSIYQVLECHFGDITATGNTINSIVLGRIFRQAVDDFNGHIAIIGGGIHHEKDSHGSVGEDLK